MFRATLNRYRTPLIFAHDLAAAAAAFLLAGYLRLGPAIFGEAGGYLWTGLPVFVAVAFGVLLVMRLDRHPWRFVSLSEFFDVLKAAMFMVVFYLPAMFLITRLEAVPRSVLAIAWLVLVGLLAGGRVLYRLFHDRGRPKAAADDPVRVLLVGAGSGADMFLRALKRDPTAPYRVVGIVDEDGMAVGQRFQGAPVLGTVDDLDKVVAELDKRGRRPQRLVLTGSRIDRGLAMALLERADALGLSLARVPRPTAFQSGFDEGVDVRSIAIEDLLGRAQTVLDREAMRALVAARRILITGAGGTIGGELARQIAAFGPACLILIDHSEHALYEIDQELAGATPAVDRRPHLCDIRDRDVLIRLTGAERPDLVFHAAALKHVPMVEDNIAAGVLTNAVGTRHVAEAARAAGAAGLILISTDKAVRPTSVMGATKRVMELYGLALAATADRTTAIVTVRFGNVLGSTGSVVPRFRKQLENGGPLTVTDPEMTRYFMTTREAVELVLAASAVGVGEGTAEAGIFVLDMGAPVRIVDLAGQMIRLAGLTPGKDVEIEIVGARPGEKPHEELFHPDESPMPANHPGLLLARPAAPPAAAIEAALDALEAAARAGDDRRCLALLAEIVPDFARAPERDGMVVAMNRRGG